MKGLATLIFTLLLCVPCISFSQITVNGTGGVIVQNAVLQDFTVDASAAGLPSTINASYGLEKLCFNMTHNNLSDLTVILQAPDGTEVFLVVASRLGGSNFTNTCLSMTGASGNFVSGVAPFTGDYIPPDEIGLVNNNQNPQGNWKLRISDEVPHANTVSLDSWSLTFSSSPAALPSPPINDDCAGAISYAVDISPTVCSTILGTTRGATLSAEAVTCSTNDNDDDVWYKISPTSNYSSGVSIKVDFDNILLGVPQAGIAIYEGSPSIELACVSTSGFDAILSISDPLLAGTDYFVRTWSVGNTTSNTSPFELCIFQNVPLPVELSSFEATPQSENSIELRWTTASETNNSGFEIQRSEDGENFRFIHWIDGSGTSAETIDYSYEDQELRKGKVYYYRLRQIDFDGSTSFSDVVEASILGIGKSVTVYPNLAIGGIRLEWYNPNQLKARLGIYDLNGRQHWFRAFVETQAPVFWEKEISLPRNQFYIIRSQIHKEIVIQKFVIVE